MVAFKIFLIALWMIFVSPTEISDVDKCVVALLEKRVPNKNSTKTLAGIVGLGWDDLRNVATIPVFATSFKKCSFVPDNDFLLPDNIVAVPVKDIALDKSSSTFDSFDDYMKESSDKISVSASGAFQGFSGSASFSNENQETKKEFFKSNSFMLQNKIVYKAYTLIANQHGRHDEYFTFRLNDIAAAIVAGKAEWVKYKSGKLIYDYGTHVVHKATVGASIEQQVFIETKEKFHGEGKMKAMKFEASAGMAGVFGVSGGYETKTNEQSSSSTKNSTTKTIIRTKGGPNINRLSNANTNASVLFMDNLVGMDKVGLYLYEIINVAKINYADDIKQKLEEAIKKATMDYYRFNTISGCTNVSAESFNFMANLNDGSCIAAKKYFGFGGIFQMCSSVYAWTITKESVPFVSLCDNIMLKNPVTKNFSCPSGYDPVLIHAYSVDFTNRTYQKEQQRCNWYSKLFNCAKTIVNETIHEKYYVKSYWCKNEIVIPPSPTTTVPSSEPKNNLDEIMDYKILTALQEEPGLLKMYFAGTYREIYNKTKVVLDPKPFQLFNTKNETETVYPDVLEITVSQIDKLANFPDVLRELIPRLKITKDSINKNTELQDQLVRNPILLKKLVPGYEIEETSLPQKPESLALFGGIFSTDHINVFTGTSSCPLNFRKYSFLDNLNICIWNDTEEDWPVNFGGFYNCHSEEQQCPRGFSQYLATDFQECPVYYCVRMINRKTFDAPTINRPPFVQKDTAMETFEFEKYKSNLS